MSMSAFARKINRIRQKHRSLAARSKYGAIRTIVEGIAFPSQLEAAVYSHHRALEKQGQCEIVALQKSVELILTFNPSAPRPHRAKYKADILIKRGTEYVYIEAKGVETGIWRMKKAAWKLTGPARLEVWKGQKNRNGEYRVWCHEVLVPPGV